MSWPKGSHHHLGGTSEIPALNISQSVSLNPNQQKIPSTWNQFYSNQPKPQPPTSVNNWYPNQTQPINYSNQFYKSSQNNNIEVNNSNNLNALSQNTIHSTMTSQYFEKPTAEDGWNDDWGDFNDDNNPSHFNQSQLPIPNLQQQQISSPNQNTVYQSPPPNVGGYLHNANQLSQQTLQPPPLSAQNQQMYQQNVTFSQPFQQHFQTNNNSSSQVYSQIQHHPPPPDTWDNRWNIIDNDNLNRNLEKNNEKLFPKVTQNALPKFINETNTNEIQSEIHSLNNYIINNDNTISTKIPDEQRNTQNLQNPVLSRVMRTEHLLTPQWSIESQASQTSSDRSIGSDNLDTRSSLTNTSDEPINLVYNPNGNNQHISYNKISGAQESYSEFQKQAFHKNNDDIDSLDQALLEMNIVKKEPTTNDLNFYQNEIVQNIESKSHENNILPLPHMSMEEKPHNLHKHSQQNYSNVDSISQATRTTSQNILPGTSVNQHMFPPHSVTYNDIPPSVSPNLPQQAQINPPQQSNLSSVATNMAAGGSINPFKRTGAATHRNHQFQPAASQPNVMPTSFYAEPTSNQENLLPENSEVPEVIENLEIAPTNERNQYLQTGHLSEEGHVGDGSEMVPPPPENNDHFPPPGLSRFVLGQPENENNRLNTIEPPPGLDRLVPGIELGSAEVNLARQADGQASNTMSQVSRIPDRNLYHVPGESVTQGQRVIPGVEHIERRSMSSIPQNINDIPIIEQQRELVMDGENVDDQPQQIQQQPDIISRQEPIEGANTLDEISMPNMNQVETESNLTYDGGRKDHSNPSTANDDSDKDRQLYYKSKRNEDSSRKRNKTKEKYDTEDTDYYSDRDRRRYQREGSVRDGRRERETPRGERDRDSREKDRPRDKREGSVRDERSDRYERDRYRDRYDRNTRYETDGSKYENESSSKYDRDGKKRYERDEYNRRRDDDYRRDDRRYRRGDRDRDERKRDDRYRDDRDRRRDRGDRRYDYEDSYNRTGSRNALDRDVEKDRRYPQNYYAAAGYNYDPYAYYQQQQQYYENLRRTNPQAYAEWYRKYYSQMQTQITGELSNADGRESVHSGRSSANGKESRYSHHQTAQQFYHHTGSIPQIHNSTFMEPSYINGINQHKTGTYLQQTRSYYSQSEFSESRIDNLDPTKHHPGHQSASSADQRLTPCKFVNDHSLVSITNSLMVCLKPNRYSNESTSIIKILNVGVNDSTKRLFHSFPGPLVRGTTHKKTVIEFCEDQIRMGPFSTIVRSRGNSVSSLLSSGNSNKSSFVLMWNLLILLLRQNGMVVGTDIAELLIKNQTEFPYEIITSTKSRGPSESGRNSIQSDSQNDNQAVTLNEETNVENLNEINNVADETDINYRKQLTEEEVTEKFRNYLLYGNVNEALDWATDNNLWGHALFLASKVDRRSHANVMMKFANKLELNDPLQTLFQLMSGRVPSAVTSVQDEKWGDWRSHLAMIISNTTQKPDLDRKAITTLGDSLYNRGDLFGAQFCYLMAQVGFGKYCNVNQESALMFNSTSTIRLILLGSSHHKNFKDFATNEAIIMTEIYEYACALNDDKFSIVEFQPYKYLLATRMLDYGFQFKTLMYMEQISNHIQKDITKYTNDFIEKVFLLGDRLKYFDPALEKTLEELSNSQLNDNFNVVEDQKWLQNLRNVLSNNQTQRTINNNEYNSNTEINDQTNHETQDYLKNQIDQQFLDINQKFSELNMRYTNQIGEDVGQNVDVNQQYNTNAQIPTIPVSNEGMQCSNNQIGNNYYQQQENITEAQQQQQHYNVNEDMKDYYAQQQPQQYNLPQENSNDNIQQPNYDYWNQPTMNTEIPKPTISMPNSMSNKPGFYDESPSTKSENNLTKTKNDKKTEENKGKSTSKDSKSSNQSGTNSGWFGGIWNKLSLKPKNQMILPDDKNPAIVWDSEKKKWVNTDGHEEASEAFKPPPKLSDFTQPTSMKPTQMQQQPQISTPMSYNPNNNNINTLNPSTPSFINDVSDPTLASNNTMMDTNKVPNLQSNMFKMQRNRTLKNSYVDVFNPSGAVAKPTENVLAGVSQIPPVPQGGYFIPGAPPQSTSDQQQNDGAPQFYNPNQYAGYQQ